MTPFPREQFEILMTWLLVLKPEGQYHFYTCTCKKDHVFLIFLIIINVNRVTTWQSHIITFMFKGFTVQHFDGNKTFKVYMHVENVINRFCVYICDY